MGTPDHYTGTQLYGVFNGALVPVAVDADGGLYALLKGWDGTTYVPLRLDADGRIEAVIQGDYAGTLSTVAVDDQGRLLIVPTDPENVWGIASYLGNAELAARLGSMSTYDRRGNVIWQTNFNVGKGCFAFSTSGTGADHYTDTASFELGGYGLVLIAGSTANRTVTMQRSNPTAPQGRTGLEVSFDIVTDVDYINLYLYTAQGDTRYDAQIKFDITNSKVILVDGVTGVEEIATSINFDPVLGFFNAVKLVVETDNSSYTRLLLNGVEYDLSTYVQTTVINGFGNYTQGAVVLTSTAGNNGEITVGRWIETRNEPTNA